MDGPDGARREHGVRLVLMAGFELPEKLVTLGFEEGDWAGAEFVCRVSPIPLSAIFEIAELAGTGELASIRDALTRFADVALISWNLESGGEPVPLDPMALPIEAATPLINTWLTQVTDLPVPLGVVSNGGAISQARPASRSLPNRSMRRSSTRGVGAMASHPR